MQNRNGNDSTKKKLTINKTALRRLTDPMLGSGFPGVNAQTPETRCTTCSMLDYGYCAEGRN